MSTSSHFLFPNSTFHSFSSTHAQTQLPVALTSNPQQVISAQAEISLAAVIIAGALAWYTGRGLNHAMNSNLRTRLRQAAHGVSAVGLVLSIGTQIFALSNHALPFPQLWVILDPAAQGVASVVLPSLFVPAFLVWYPHLVLLCAVNLTLLPIVGLKYEAALAKAIAEVSQECLNAVRLEGCRATEWAIWGLLVASVIGVVLLNLSQYLHARRATAGRTQQRRRPAGRVDILDNPLTQHLKHRPEKYAVASFRGAVGVMLLITAIVILLVVWMILDREIYLPLIKLE